MKSLLKWVKSRFDAAPGLGTVFGGLSLTWAMDTQAMPYAAVSYAANQPKHAFGGSDNRIDNITLRFDFWALSAITLVDAIDAMRTHFDSIAYPDPLDDGSRMVGCLMERETAPAIAGHDAGNNVYYRAEVEYTFTVSK